MNPTGHPGKLAPQPSKWARALAILSLLLILAGALPTAGGLSRALAQVGEGDSAGAPAGSAAAPSTELEAKPIEGDGPGAAPAEAAPVDKVDRSDAPAGVQNFTGGPDGFGYTVDDNESHPAHGNMWQDISSSGVMLASEGMDPPPTALTSGTLDDGYWTIPFPFPFKFYGVDRDGADFHISTNGFATFDANGALEFANVGIPDAVEPAGAVYPFWDDLTVESGLLTCGPDPDLDCGVYYQVVGSAPNRKLIVQWNEVRFVADPDAGYVTFQVQLLEASGEIRFEYRPPQDCALDDCERASGGSATIGIEADGGTDGLQYSFNSPTIMTKPGVFLQNVVFHPPALTLTKNCFTPESALNNPSPGGTSEVVIAGQQWICRIEVRNSGPGPIPNVRVTDAFTTGLRLVYSGLPSTPSVPVNGPANVTFEVGTVPANDSVVWELGFIVNPNYVANTPFGEAEICNEAMIVSPMTLTSTPSRETARDCDVVKDRADLKVSKFVEPFTGVRAGDIFTYTIYVDNLGPSVARNVAISDTFLSSGNVSIQSCAFSVSQGGGAISQFTCTTGSLVSTQFGSDIGTFRTNMLEPLSPTSQGRLRASFRLVARNDIDTTNTVRVSANTPDPDMSNNMAMVNLSVSSVADVFVTKSDGGATPDAGEQFTYLLRVGNNGPSEAENVVLTDVLPLELEIISITPTALGPPPPGGPGTCATTQSAAGNEVVTCNFGTLPLRTPDGTAQREVRIVVRVKEGTPEGTTLFNEARVSSDEFDDDNRNNIAVDDTPVGQLSSFLVFKTCTPDPVNAGGVLHCAYTMTNNGPSTANNVTFTDTWITGGEFLTLISANSQGHPGGNTCYQEDNGTQTEVRCSFGDVPVGRTIRLDLEFAVDPSTPQDTNLFNCFQLGADSPISIDLASDNCEATLVRGVSDVLITKVASDPSPVAGTDFSYKYVVRNNGPSTAFDVTVTDTLPDGLEFLSVNDARCSESGGQVTCEFGDMLPGAMIMFEVFVRLDADFDCGDELQNNVRVRWNPVDGGFEFEAAGVSVVTVDCVSDLKVTKVGKPDDVVDEDELLTYTIIVDNLGPSFAEDVSIKDVIAASGQFDVEAVSSDRDAQCRSLPAPISGNPFDPSDDLDDGTGETGNLTNLYQLDCTLDDPLEVLKADGPPNSGRWIVQITVDGDEPGSINNIVTTLSDSLDSDQSNNMAMTEHEVVSVANLSITKDDRPNCDDGDDEDFVLAGPAADGAQSTDGLDAPWPGNFCDMNGDGDTVVIAGLTNDPEWPGSSYHYRLSVRNRGPGQASNVVVTDALPLELEVVHLRSSEGTCTTVQGPTGQQVVTCNLGNLPEGASESIDIFVRVPADVPDGTILFNEADVTSDSFDPDTSDNRDTERTEVIAVADLELTKEDDPDPTVAGGSLTYRLFVRNLGSSVARNVRVSDPLPIELEAISADVIGVTDELCSINANGSGSGRDVISCELGDLDPGAEVRILINTRVRADAVPANDDNQCVTINNQATVSSDTKDPRTSNNSNATNVAGGRTTVCAEADLKITKTSHPEKVNAGEQKKYTIEVENLGPSDAHGVTVWDVLPDEALYEVDTNGAMCTQPQNLIGFRALLNGANEVPPVPGSGMGLATFVLDTTTNMLTYAVFVNDMSSAITAAHIHTGVAGVNGGVLVNLFTGGPSPFDESHPLVGMVQLAPADAAAIAAAPQNYYVNVHTTQRPGGEIRGQMARSLQSPLKCEIGDLPAGAKRSFDFYARIDANTMADMLITNVAIVKADAPPDSHPDLHPGDPFRNLYNNADFSKNFIENKADLRVTKFGKPDGAVRAGEVLTYTVIVDNLGPSIAKGVSLKDVMRSSGFFTLLSIASDRDATCETEPGGAYVGNPVDAQTNLEIDCVLDDPLGVLEADGFPNPGRWLLTMRVRANQTQDINNVADVLSDALDPDLSNNHAIVEHDITDVADLRLDKSGPMMVVAGETITYEIEVENLGSSDAENVVVYDRLPPGIVVTSATVLTDTGANGGSCTTGQAGNPLDKLQCKLGTIRQGRSSTITIVADVDPGLAAGTILENDAFVLSDIFDDDNSNNADFVLTSVKSVADLEVTKTSDRDDAADNGDDLEGPAVAGTIIEYTIRVTNNGPSDAADVLVVDQLPAGTTFVSATITEGAGTCEGLPTGEVKCQLGTLPAGESVEIVIRAFVEPSYDCTVDQLYNVVEVTSPSDADGASTELYTEVVCDADLLIQKWSDPVKVYAGEQKKYTVKVTNLGPSDAENVVVVDTLPNEAEYEIDTGLCDVVSGEPDVVTCDVGTLPPGGMWQVDIYARIDANTPPGTVIVNEAEVSSSTPDSNEANNIAESENLVLQKADLKVRKFGKPDANVRAGEILTYTVIVDNYGPSWADGVALKDVLQTSGDFDLIDVISDRDASCKLLPQGSVPTSVALPADPWPPVDPPLAFGVDPVTGIKEIANRLEMDCTLDDPLAVLAADGPQNAGRWIITMRVRAAQTQSINNVAEVLSEAYDPDRSNNSAFVEHEITDVADLSVVKTQVDGAGNPVNPPTIIAGTPIWYKIVVRNAGPSDAENVLLYDRLPPGITVTGVTIDGVAAVPGEGVGACTTGQAGSAIDQLKCGLGTLRVSQSKTVTIRADVSPWVPEGTKLENDAFVASDIFDDDDTDNYSHVITMVMAEADLWVRKTGDPNPLKAGVFTTYDIEFFNEGPSAARDVILRDRLPFEFDLISAYVEDGSPVSDSATCFERTEDPALADELTCELGDIGPGQGGKVVVVAFIQTATPDGVYTNTAWIESDTTDPDDDNNLSTFDTTVAPMADLLVEKWSSPVKVNAGEQKKYTVRVTNLGPSDALNVVMTDTLPKEVDYEIDTGLCTVAQDSGPNGEDVVTCRFGTIRAGESRSVDIYALVQPGTAPGIFITNRADVTSDTPDGINEANNTAYSENFILHKADLKVTKFGKRDGNVRAEDILTYTVIVDNLGPSFAWNPQLKDVLQTSGKFELLDIHSNRATTCRVLKAGLAPTTVNLPATAWPIVAPVPPLPAVGDIDQRVEVNCDLDGTLEVLDPDAGPPNDGRWILTMRVRARQAQSVNNVASVTNWVPIEGDPNGGNLATDPDPSNNMAMVEHEITDVADLSVTKSAIGQNVTGCEDDEDVIQSLDQDNAIISNLPDEVTAGLELTYTIEVLNHGPSNAENVVVTDRLPPGVTVIGGTINGSAAAFEDSCVTGTAGSAADKLTCGLPLMVGNTSPSHHTITVTVFVHPDLAHGTILENDVYVTSDIFDDNVYNNRAFNLTTVNTAADLRLEKSDDPDPVVAGELLRYTLAVTNDGPSVSRNVHVYDNLPDSVTYVGSIGAPCFQDPVSPGDLVCQLGDMQPGETRYVYLVVLVSPDAPMLITNEAVAQSRFTDDTPNPFVDATSEAEGADQVLSDLGTYDPCPNDNFDTEDTTVIRETDPFIMKTDLTDPVIAGKEARFLVMFGNNGPSTATKVDVMDILPNGFMFDRCESLDPNDKVSCTVSDSDGNAANGDDMRKVTLLQILGKNSVLWHDDNARVENHLQPGESFSFIIVADVNPGYVLDGQTDGGTGGACKAFADASGYLFWAHDRATIMSANDAKPPVKEVDTNANNNFDDECTRVNAEADLEIVKTDIFGDPVENPDNYFLECDPVEPGGMITYDLTVINHGMSDAAQVQVTDWLPGKFVVLDPNQVLVTIFDDEDGDPTGQVVEVRDDGRITVILGNDPARKGVNAGDKQLGRINADSSHRFRIQVMVVNPWASMEDKRFVNPMPPYDDICGAILTNRAEVTTIKGPLAIWPLANQTPTLDPNLANNTDTETTTIECPAIKVRKTVSYDGTCPGAAVPTVARMGAMITFCIEVTNVGTTYLDNIEIVDKLHTSMGVQEFRRTITHGKDPKMPVAPGETVLETIMIPPLTDMCGTATNWVDVTATPVNSGRTVYPCLSPVAHSDSINIFVPCGGADYRLQLPALNNDECETWLQVQNVGSEPTVAIGVFWGEPGACPPQAAGPLKTECSGLLKPGSAWTWTSTLLPLGIKSGIVYSINANDIVEDDRGNKLPFSDLACEEIFFSIVGDYDEWVRFDLAYTSQGRYITVNDVVLDFGKHQGQPVAVSVNRTCPDPVDPNRNVSAAYVGVGTYLEGAMDPVFGDFSYYAPLIFANKGGLNSLIHIHNSGTRCSSIEIWFKAQDNCLRPILGDVLAVAPGESAVFDPNTVVGPDWLGSAWIRASQPLGIVVDTFGPNHFTSYLGFPSDSYDDDKETYFSIGSQVNYAPLIYSEYQGWDSAIQVQNLSGTTAAKVKVYFLDRSGDVITTLVDWICPRGSQTYFLPVIAGLPGNWVGHARVESQEWWTPGTHPVDPPRIQSVALLEKWADPARSERREAVAYNLLTEQVAFDWQVGKLNGGQMSGSAVLAVPLVAKGNRGITSELAITNLVTKPGFTDFAIYVYDQNGLLDATCQKLHEQQVEYIDFNTWGLIPPRFLGSAVISATFWEHDVFDPQGKFQRNLVGLGGVVVERIGGTQGGADVPGDESKAFEMIPIFDYFTPQRPYSCPGQPDFP